MLFSEAVTILRRFLPALILFGVLPRLAYGTEVEGQMLIYIGTYTGPKSKGIYWSRFDAKTGKLSAAELAAEAKNPTFLAIHPNRRFLYAVGETSDVGSNHTGAV